MEVHEVAIDMTLTLAKINGDRKHKDEEVVSTTHECTRIVETLLVPKWLKTHRDDGVGKSTLAIAKATRFCDLIEEQVLEGL